MAGEARKIKGHPIRHKHKEPFNPVYSVPKEFSEWTYRIFQLESELDRFVLSERDYYDLIVEAFASNIHISTKMEGNPLSMEDVRKITRDSFSDGITDEKTDFPMQEILNHLLVWLDPHFSEEWTTDTVKAVHWTLMDENKKVLPGQFRTTPSVIKTSKGQETFIPAPAKHIESELNIMLEWLNNYGAAFHPVVAGAIMFHEFESIHPFKDGNGRCGRTLFHGYLQTHGLPNSRLCMMEKEIVKDPEEYYEILAWADQEGDYSELISHFTRSVLTSYEKAYDRFKQKDLLSGDIDETSKRLVIKAKHEGEWFSIQEANGWCEGESDYILRDRLNGLVEKGALVTRGQTRSKQYRFADPFPEIRRKLELPLE